MFLFPNRIGKRLDLDAFQEIELFDGTTLHNDGLCVLSEFSGLAIRYFGGGQGNYKLENQEDGTHLVIFTPKQRRVWGLMLERRRHDQMAVELNISRQRVKKHIINIWDKFCQNPEVAPELLQQLLEGAKQ